MEDNKITPNAEDKKETTTDRTVSQPHGNDGEPHLRSFGFTPSESATTNIPPRLPMGYTYASPKEETEAESTAVTEDTTTEESIIQQHPDLPDSPSPMRTSEDTDNQGVRVRKPRRKNREAKKAIKRYGWWALIVILLVAIGSTYPYWSDLMNSWHESEPTPAVAADTLPTVKPEPIDTTPVGLTHEDSMRIQDSVRHARWLYWQRQKRAKEAKEQETEETENATSTTASEHSAAHSDTIR